MRTGKGRLLALLLCCVLPLSGCTALLERSYGGVEPYADRYWDPGAEDTLRVENYQDLVNSLLMLIEQRAEAGTIRCYGEANSLALARAAAREVRQETMLGAYLLESLRYSHESNAAGGYTTFTYELIYREDAEDPEGMMSISDSQSLVDLLRLAVREGHERLTARFSYHVSRQAVMSAVESLWEELCQDEIGQQQPAAPAEPALEEPAPQLQGGGAPEEEDAPPSVSGSEDEAAPDTGKEDLPAEDGQEPAEDGQEPAEDGEEAPPPPVYPPCPWTVRFYPDMDTVELVEILLKDA